MQVAQVDFIFGDAPDSFERGDEELAGERAFWTSFLVSDWGRHGQHVSDGHPFLEIERGRRAWLRVPDVDSLEPKHDDHHATKNREKLRELNVRIAIQMLGEDLDDERPTGNDRTREICRCEKRSSLILFNRFYSQEIPLRCDDCFGLVPLYNIPFDDVKQYEPYDDLYSWQRNYNGCDTLQLGCTLAEKWALCQMGRPRASFPNKAANCAAAWKSCSVCRSTTLCTATTARVGSAKKPANVRAATEIGNCPKSYTASSTSAAITAA